MILTKGCNKKHNIRNRSIRIGTLQYYRNTENQEIADKLEGFLRFHLVFEGTVTMSTENFNTLNQGGICINDGGRRYPGKTSAHMNYTNLDLNRDFVTTRDSRAVIDRYALNSFVFCMSKFSTAEECVGLFESYDDYWTLPYANVDAFAAKLAEQLGHAIWENRDAGTHIIPHYIDDNKLDIQWLASEVSYIPRESHFKNASAEEVEDFMKKMEFIEFIKPPSFESEKEFRFSFKIVSDGKLVEPLVEYIDLDSTPLINLTADSA